MKKAKKNSAKKSGLKFEDQIIFYRNPAEKRIFEKILRITKRSAS